MTNRPSSGDQPAPEGTRARPVDSGLASLSPALGLALGAAALVGLLWFGLSIATGLIYHFMPGAPFLAAAAVFRWATHSRRANRTEITEILTGSLIVVAAGLLAVPAAGGSLDPPALVAAVSIGGFVLALTWLRRPGSASVGRSSPDGLPE